MGITIFCGCSILTLLFAIPIFILLDKITEYKHDANIYTDEAYNNICNTFGILFVILGIYGFVFILTFLSTFDPYFYLRRLMYYKVYVPIIIYAIVLLGITLKLYFTKSYKNYKRTKKICEKLKFVKNAIKYFSDSIYKLRNNKNINDDMKESMENEFSDLIQSLKMIYSELYRSYDVVVLNNVIGELSDIEINAADYDKLQTQIDKFEAYRSLSDISNELKNLMKKYDK